jgi:general secretion pathway protein C
MLVAVGILGWVLAYWAWAWLSPPTEARVETAIVATGQPTLANDLFGQIQQQSAPVGVTIQLLGVIAESGKEDSYAILRFGEQPVRPVRKGTELSPGVVLSEVHPSNIVIDRNGVSETIALPEKRSAQ